MSTPELWALVILFSLTMYAILDGFDLGVGVLLLFHRTGEDRDRILNSVYPTWDGNETWVVLVGVGLFGGFPLAYATLLPVLYVPLVGMLLAIIFRGIALEFRFNAEGDSRRVWDLCFGWSSLLVIVFQGFVIGALVYGLLNPEYFAAMPPDPLAFLNPSGFVMVALFLGLFTLHGFNWLALKSEEPLKKQFRKTAEVTGILTAALLTFAVVAYHKVPGFYGTEGPYAFSDTFNTGTTLTLVAAYLAIIAMIFFHRANRQHLAFTSGVALIVSLSLGVSFKLWPGIVPSDMTITQASAQGASDTILLYAAFAVIPVILAYTAYGYWVFGKIPDGDFAYKRSKKEQEYLNLELQQPKRPSPAPVERVGSVIKWVIAIGWVLMFFTIGGPLGVNPVLIGLPALMAFTLYGLYAGKGE